MRDLNRLKVKYTFQLDSQQVLMIFVGLLCVCALVFSLGVMFGKRLGGLAEPQAPAVAEQQEAAVEAEPTPDPSGVDRLPKPAVEEPAPKPAAPPTELPATTPSTQEPTPAPAAPPEPAPAPAPTPKPKPQPAAPAPEPTPAPAPEPSPAPATDTATAAAQPSTQYAVQISSFREEEQAKTFVKSFQSFDNRKPYIVHSEVPGKGSWYRVKIGRFDTREQAMAYQSIFEARTGRQTMLSTVN